MPWPFSQLLPKPDSPWKCHKCGSLNGPNDTACVGVTMSNSHGLLYDKPCSHRFCHKCESRYDDQTGVLLGHKDRITIHYRASEDQSKPTADSSKKDPIGSEEDPKEGPSSQGKE